MTGGLFLFLLTYCFLVVHGVHDGGEGGPPLQCFGADYDVYLSAILPHTRNSHRPLKLHLMQSFNFGCALTSSFFLLFAFLFTGYRLAVFLFRGFFNSSFFGRFRLLTLEVSW